MPSSLAQSAIAFLIDLAEQGEIDPWDVNVIDVIDRFLKTIKDQAMPVAEAAARDSATAAGRSSYEQNLSESGQAFLYAAMLVLLKADTLIRAEIQAEAEPDFEDEFFEPGELTATALPRNLERHIHRRAVAAPPEKRQVTLQELIGQLESIAEAMNAPRSRAQRIKPHSKRKAVRAIAQLAHQENLSEIAAALETFLDKHWETLDTLDWIDFELLLEHWASFRPEVLGGPITHQLTESDYRHEKVGVFWGLLFLSSQAKVELGQDTFYQDLKVRHLGHLSATPEGDVPSYILPD